MAPAVSRRPPPPATTAAAAAGTAGDAGDRPGLHRRTWRHGAGTRLPPSPTAPWRWFRGGGGGRSATAAPATDGDSALPLPLVLVRVLVLSTRRLRRRSLSRRAAAGAAGALPNAAGALPTQDLLSFDFFVTNTHQTTQRNTYPYVFRWTTRSYGSEIEPKSVFLTFACGRRSHPPGPAAYVTLWGGV